MSQANCVIARAPQKDCKMVDFKYGYAQLAALYRTATYPYELPMPGCRVWKDGRFVPLFMVPPALLHLLAV